MSTPLAIASVTYILKDLLNNGIIDQDITGFTGGNVTVTSLPPDRVDTTPTNTESQLNLFMYQVTPNQGWRNRGLPSRDARGDLICNQPLALNLHYLLTAYGVGELHSEILLGYGMQLFHETPVLIRDAIHRALSPPLSVADGMTTGLPPELQSLSTSELAEQVEHVKIIPESLSNEEISKLWAAFQAKYRPTAAYMASVVLIESRKSTRSALPVRERLGYVTPFKHPIVEEIQSQAAPGAEFLRDQQILEGYTLGIVGKRLRHETVTTNVGGIVVTPVASDVSDTQITVPVPVGLSAGVKGVQVIHQILMGDPPLLHRGVESNIVPFVLHPRIVSLTHTLAGSPVSPAIELTVRPPVHSEQRVVLLLNELSSIPTSPPETTIPLSYSFQLASSTLAGSPTPTETLTIPISAVQAGTYLARVQVDGAESPLIADASGRYNAPQVVIP